jgi:hypothetical protein
MTTRGLLLHENVDDDRYRGVGFIDPRLSVATLVRLLLPDLFAGHYDSLLYLDCDLTIHADVSQLFRLDIGACPGAAAGHTVFHSAARRGGRRPLRAAEDDPACPLLQHGRDAHRRRARRDDPHAVWPPPCPLTGEGAVHTGTSTARGPDRYHERVSARSSVRIPLPPHVRITMAAPLGPPPPPRPAKT